MSDVRPIQLCTAFVLVANQACCCTMEERMTQSTIPAIDASPRHSSPSVSITRMSCCMRSGIAMLSTVIKNDETKMVAFTGP